MTTIDILLQSICIKGLILRIIPREPIIRMRDIQPAIRSTLERTKDTTPRARPAQSDVQKDLERSSTLTFFCQREAAIGLNDTLVLVSQANFGEGATGDEEACGIGGCPVFEAVFDAVAGEFGRVGCGKNDIALEFGVNDLADLAKTHQRKQTRKDREG
jgi:hypothetical protein